MTVDDHICNEDHWKPELRWALATGYSSVQRTLHRLDEMLIEAEPKAALTGDALHDALCLSGSTMADRDALMARLRAAIQVISPQAYRYFFPVGGAPSAGEPADGAKPTDAEAREVLREVRYAINEFRDDRVDGLIRARNRLLWVVLTVGITAYLALGLALHRWGEPVRRCDRQRALPGRGAGRSRQPPPHRVGPFVGDRGLRAALRAPDRHAPPVRPRRRRRRVPGRDDAGAAHDRPPGNRRRPDHDHGRAARPVPIFDLATNQSALLVAAVFGLVPAQLFSGLQRQADRFQVDLEKSAPAGESTLNTGLT